MKMKKPNDKIRLDDFKLKEHDRMKKKRGREYEGTLQIPRKCDDGDDTEEEEE